MGPIHKITGTLILLSLPAFCQPAPVESQRALLQQYCIACHNERKANAGINFTHADFDHIPANAQMWERVIRKVRAGAMPPLGLPRPDRNALDGFAAYLETSIDQAALHPDPGPSILRRLNRAEYGAAIHDLLGLDVDVASLLPADDSNHGFDNNAGSLRISPSLLEAYLAASRKITRLAIGDRSIPSSYSTYRTRPDLGQDAYVEGLPLGTRGGLLVSHLFPLDGVYVFKTKLAVNTSAKVRGLDYEHKFIITIDGVKIHEASVGGPADVDAAALNPPEAEREIVKRLDVRVHVKAGPHEIGVTFLRKTSAQPDGYLQPWLRSNFDTQEQRGVPLVESLSIGGPFENAGAGDTPSRRKIFVCHPQSANDLPCARKILTALAVRAYRRPVNDRDLETLLGLFQEGENRSGNSFEAGIENALRFMIASPAFLFRVESDPSGAAPGSVHPVSDLELASRISFFLWSSVPDEDLLGVASRGELKDATLNRQVRRMLLDPRSRALSTNFAGQWLYLRNLSGATRDLAIFPDFDDNLRQGFREETEMFFDSVVREDHSALDLLTADYTFLNERLAKHYGIPNVRGDYFRRVTIPGESRRGLLGQGSVLTVTSYATRTSPVLRGKWLLDNVLGAPVPPPPPDVPSLAENRTGLKPRSVRERMEEHRANPACGVCHNVMDPLGFSLENFDATGAWRNRTEAKGPVDASGTLVDGSKVNGPVALRNALLSRPELFVTTFTEKLMTYALGRGIEYYDMPAVRAIVRQAARDHYRLSTLVWGIIHSAPFRLKRTDADASAVATAGHKEISQ